MAELRTSRRTAGFSLVELLVALVFTMVLMAGMATVFKASLTTFYTAGEATSSVRRNRMSVDMLGQDLNTACMYLLNLTDPPAADPNHPPFYVLPNMTIVGDPNKLTADQIYFQVDQPLMFSASLQPGGGANTAQSVVANGGALAANNADNTFLIECGSNSYATQVAQGQYVVFKDTFDYGIITSVAVTGAQSTQVQVVLGPDPMAAVTGIGSTGLPLKEGHIASSGVVFVQPTQIVRYQLQYLNLDPSAPIPCLVRDQGTWVNGIFTANPNVPQQIISDNVQNFKVYLSVNSGQSWAGWNKAYQDMTSGWNNGMLQELTAQFNTVAPSGFATITGNPNWFRTIPTLVRVDLTTRSATQRTEYYTPTPSQPVGTAYKALTQSLIFMPRHSGLPMSNP